MNFAIIAAGEGSRLAAEGIAAPKPLVMLDGRPMIARLIDIFRQAGAESISVIVNEEMHQVQEYLAECRDSLPIPLNIVVKSTPGSMHSLAALTEGLPEGKFILTTVDTIFRDEIFRDYAAAFAAAPADTALMGVTDYIDDEKPLYVGVRPDMTIDGYYDARPDDIRYISVYGLRKDIACRVLDECMSAGKLRMRQFQRALLELPDYTLRAYPLGKVFDVDHASDIEKARDFLKNE